MEKGNTKNEILNVALDLFSTNGYEATSVSQIADAVGIRKSSLYSHFENKQAILDGLIKRVLEEYDKNSMFSKTKRRSDDVIYPITCDDVACVVKSQLTYILHDSFISKSRKMLMIEQFRNKELAILQTKQNYSDILSYFTDLMTYLKSQRVLSGDNPEIMAAQFCLPITVWINLCDREPEKEEEVLELVEKHIRQFFKLYKL